MKEKDRKRLEKEKFLEFTKATAELMQPPKKDISTLIRYHANLRQAFFEEIIESLLGEESLLTKLERYGENSNFWKECKTVYESSNAKSKGPSAAWLRAKVKFYESQATI